MIDEKTLNEKANAWLEQAGEYLGDKLLGLMKEGKMKKSNAAEYLNVGDEAIDDILAGYYDEVSLDTASRILIASGAVKVDEEKNADGWTKTSTIPLDFSDESAEDDDNEDDEDEDVLETNRTVSSQPYRDANGRFARRPTEETENGNPFSRANRPETEPEGEFIETEVPRSELKRAIRETNLLAEEYIDVEGATNAELLEYLHRHHIRFGRGVAPHANIASEEANHAARTSGRSGLSDEEKDDIADRFRQALENPELANKIRSFFN